MGKIDERLLHLLFEVGMLKKTPRTGYQFLGSGKESVADHSFRVVFIGYILSLLHKEVDQTRLLKMCLIHDLPETRTGDLNYVNKKYVKADDKKAINDQTKGLWFATELLDLYEEYTKCETIEAKLAHDADQLDLMLELKENLDLGNKFSQKWLEAVIKRLKTTHAREIAQLLISMDYNEWWLKDE